MIVTPEIAGLFASVLGLLGLVARKARCFARRVGGKWQYGVGFSEKVTFQEIKQDVNIQLGCRREPVTKVQSDPAPLTAWGRALQLPVGGLSNRK